MSALSKSMCTSDAISLATRFAKAFGLSSDLVIEKHVEFLMSSIEKTASKNAINSDSLNLSECERVTKASLRLLPSYLKLWPMFHGLERTYQIGASNSLDDDGHATIHFFWGDQKKAGRKGPRMKFQGGQFILERRKGKGCL